MLFNLFSSWERRGLVFFFLLFFLVFHVFGFHHISEEVCVLICFLGLFILFSFYLTKVAIHNLKKTWYSWYLEGLDVFNVSLLFTYNAFALLVSNKMPLNTVAFYMFFSSFLEGLFIFSLSTFHGWMFLFENSKIGHLINVYRSVSFNFNDIITSALKYN